jgi:O-antigen ligase
MSFPLRYFHPAVLLTFFSCGILATSGHDFVNAAIVFVAAIYAFGQVVLTGGGTNEKSDGFVKAYSIFAALGLAALTAFSPNAELAFSESQAFLFFILTLLATANSPVNVVLNSLKVLVLVASAFALCGIFGEHTNGLYAHGPFDDTNLFGALMLSALVLAATFLQQAYRSESKLRSVMWGLVSAILAIAAYQSHSRGAWAAGIVAVLASLFVFRARLTLSRKAIVTVAAVIIALGVGAMAAKTMSDLGQHNGLGASANSRISILKSTVHMIEEHPIAGVGWGAWSSVYPSYRLVSDTDSAGTRAHNDYLEGWASGGLLGLGELLAIPAILFVGIRRARRAFEANAWVLAGMTAAASVLVLQASVNFIFHQAGIAILAGTLLGGIFAFARYNAISTNRKYAASPLRQLAGLGILAAGAYLAVVPFFSALPARIIEQPLSKEGVQFGWLMTDSNLHLLSELYPISSIPPFAAGHKEMIAGLLEKHDGAKRKEHLDRALSYFEQGKRRNALDPTFDLREGLIDWVYPGLTGVERYTRSTESLEHALTLNPANYPATQAYVDLQARYGYPDKARQAIDRAEAASPAGGRKLYEDLWGLVISAKVKHAKAVE